MLPDTTSLSVRAATLAALGSRQRPIVLIDRAHLDTGASARIAANVAPGCPTLGLMLPYTPIHHLLLHDVDRPLVMTSGNRSDEPMACEDSAALEQLAGIADLFLTHDRRIDARCDDTVVRVSAERIAMVRRARGYAPAPLALAEAAPAGVLAVGGHAKNAFCLAAGRHAWVSSHIGDLETAESYLALRAAVAHMTRLLDIEPLVVAHDLHPDYLSTRLAAEMPAARRIAVQHHHAHVLSCIAEHRCTEPVIGVSFDGAGLGTDGAIWGGEFLVAEEATFHRAAHLAYVALPGGDAAAREPWRMAVSHLTAAHGARLGPTATKLANRIDPARLELARQMIARGINTPMTSSIGRLFDAVAALVGLRDRASHEGQAAMELEAIAAAASARGYQFELDTAAEPWQIHAAPVIRDIARDVAAGRSREDVSAMFHDAVATMIAEVASAIARRTGIRRVCLTGGVFQNARLTRSAADAIARKHLDVMEHRCVPCNDGGLSLGQALQAIRVVRANGMNEGNAACV
jgi:hydrogenase maturation protein HypF